MPKLVTRRRMLLVPLVAFVVAAFASYVPALAQGETTSAIVGSVTDQTGAGITGVAVTITSRENGLTRSVNTDDDGRFSFPQLKPGTYSVKVETARFQAQQRNSVIAGLGQKQTVDFNMTIASEKALT